MHRLPVLQPFLVNALLCISNVNLKYISGIQSNPWVSMLSWDLQGHTINPTAVSAEM